MAKDGQVWMNQNQLAELLATSTQNISLYIVNMLKDKELDKNSVIKEYLITAADGFGIARYVIILILQKLRYNHTDVEWFGNGC